MDGCMGYGYVRAKIDVIRGGFNGEQTESVYLTD
jgi:hypothetical protein